MLALLPSYGLAEPSEAVPADELLLGTALLHQSDLRLGLIEL
jgi:hypothetical protein